MTNKCHAIMKLILKGMPWLQKWRTGWTTCKYVQNQNKTGKEAIQNKIRKMPTGILCTLLNLVVVCLYNLIESL
jgi:hypothetical protein